MIRPFVTLLRGALLFLLGAVALLAALSTGKTIAYADEQRELSSGETEKLDAVLLLDTSGSMLKTDPQALRYEGAKLFVNLLRPGDRVAVIAFDQSARVVSSFVPHEDEAATKALENIVGALPATGEYTDLLAGVEAARELIRKERRPGVSTIILLLSDGKMDPSPQSGTAAFRSEQLLNSVLPELKADSVKVNTLYFSEQADKQLLTEIALASEGVSAFAPSVDVIHKSFADLFLAVKKPQVVPLTGRGFSIDNDVQEATFYLNRAADQDLVLINPSENQIRSDTSDSSITWFVGKRFDVVTVAKPEPGPWKVQGLASADGFATVLTNLKLVSDWPNSVSAGEPTLLQVRLNEGDKPVVLPEVSTNTRYGVQIIPTDKVSEPILEEPLFDDGTHGDKIAGDGIFSHTITLAEPGEYRMWLVAKGPTFDRRQQLPFKVKPPLIQIVVEEVGKSHPKTDARGVVKDDAVKDDAAGHDAAGHDAAGHDADKADAGKDSADKDGVVHPDVPSTGEETKAELDKVEIFIRLSTEALGFKNVAVSLIAIDEGRKRFLIPVEKGHEPTEYEVPVVAFPHDGVYRLEATLKAEGKKRGPIEVESRPVRVTIMRGVDAPAVVALAIGEVPKKPLSPWPYAGGVLLLNGAAAAFLFITLRKQQSGVATAVPSFVPATAAQEFIARLEQRALAAEIDLSDESLQGVPTATTTEAAGEKEVKRGGEAPVAESPPPETPAAAAVPETPPSTETAEEK